MKSYIPSELEYLKNEMLTMRSFESVCYFEKDGIERSAPYVLRKLNMRPLKKPHQNVSGYVQFWRFKEAIGRAAAHGYSCKANKAQTHSSVPKVVAREVETARFCELQTKCAQLEARLDAAESELGDVRAALGESKAMIRMALNAKPICDEPGVYFLCDDHEVVYVGMSSVSVRERTEGRANLVRTAKMIPAANKAECAQLEKRWIRFLKPRANTNLVN